MSQENAQDKMDSAMMTAPKPPTQIPEDLTPLGKAAVKLVTDVAPSAVPLLATLMSYIGLVNAGLATVAGLLGIWYMILRIKRARQGLKDE